MVIELGLTGDIWNIEFYSNPQMWIADMGDDPVWLQEISREIYEMFEPLDISAGIYRVTGIEGQYFDGYCPNWVLPEGNYGWQFTPSNGRSWLMYVPFGATRWHLCTAAARSLANGYPNVNHVWFEGCTINTEYRTIDFSMGS